MNKKENESSADRQAGARTRASTDRLDREVIEYLKQEAQEVQYPEGKNIVHRGDQGKAFYVVLSGSVEVRLVDEEGRRLPLNRLGKGSFFGEMALLTGEPVSADVVALTPSTILHYPARLFNTALAECEPLRLQILTGLADHLRSTSSEAWNFYQRAEALNVLMDAGLRYGAVIAVSPRMKKVEERIGELAGRAGPVLITGKPGTGKVFASAKIHQAAGEGERPFIVVDCRTISGEDSIRFLFGSSRFGGEEGGFSDVDALRAYGALQLADGGVLVLRHIEALDSPSMEILSGYLEKERKKELYFPRTRLMATTGRDLRELAGKDLFHKRLAEQLSVEQLSMPSLLERRQDIIPLARLFLEEREDGEDLRFAESAEHALVSLRYNHGNAAELKEAVDLGALFAEENEIRAEHIFTGPKDEGSPLEFDLGQVPLVQKIIGNPALFGLRAGVLLVFSAIMILSLAGGGSGPGRFANYLTWGLWWPLLMVLFLFVGRVWCTVCPLSTAGRLACRVKELALPPPPWVKKYTGWLIMVGFLIIIWAEHIFNMPRRPFGAGILLLSLTAAAAILSVFYQREVWCRYLCPLGNLAAVYSLPATVNVRANPSVCATYCTTHECHKGSEAISGCPVFHHPLYARDGHFCKLCLNCLKSCPHGSARLYLRMPLQSIWRQPDLSEALVPFSLFVFFVSLFMLASLSATWASTPAGFTMIMLTAVVLAALFKTSLPGLLSKETDPDPALASRVSFALLVLGWGPAMAFHLANVPGLDSLWLHAASGSFLARHFPSREVSLLLVIQVAAVVFAGALAATALWRIRLRFEEQGVKPTAGRWRILQLFCLIYLAVALGLVLPGGVLW